MDLNIKYKGSASEREVSSTLRRLQELGWQGMAWNQHILSKATVKNTVKPRPDSTASGPITGNSVHHGTNMSTVDFREIAKTRVMVDSSISSSSSVMWSFRQLHRLTITIDDVMDVQSLTSTNELLRSFDILAVCPGNYKVFATCCRQADIDVISFDFSHRVPFAINKKLVDIAVQRGICFEIKFSPTFHSPSNRKEIFSGTKHLIKVLRGRNLIFTSGAEQITHIRGPHEAINVALMMKLNQQHAHDAIKKNCEQVIQHGIARKNRFLPIEIISNSKEEVIELPTFHAGKAGRKRNLEATKSLSGGSFQDDDFTECYSNKRRANNKDEESDDNSEENDDEEEEDEDDQDQDESRSAKITKNIASKNQTKIQPKKVVSKPTVEEEQDDDDGFLKL